MYLKVENATIVIHIFNYQIVMLLQKYISVPFLFLLVPGGNAFWGTGMKSIMSPSFRLPEAREYVKRLVFTYKLLLSPNFRLYVVE